VNDVCTNAFAHQRESCEFTQRLLSRGSCPWSQCVFSRAADPDCRRRV